MRTVRVEDAGRGVVRGGGLGEALADVKYLMVSGSTVLLLALLSCCAHHGGSVHARFNDIPVISGNVLVSKAKQRDMTLSGVQRTSCTPP